MARDTDQDWQILGESEPFFGVLSAPEFLSANLDDTARDAFWASGERDIAFFLTSTMARFPDFAPRSAIDFGCGVGRLSRAMLKYVPDVIGVDVSEGMRRTAQGGAPAGLTIQADLPDRPVDWIVSHIVFQHIMPEKGYAIFRNLLACLAPRGAIMIHFSIYKDQGYLPTLIPTSRIASWDGDTLEVFDQTPYPPGTMHMYDYNLSRLAAIMHESGFNSFQADHVNHSGSHGVFIFAQRD